MQTYIKIVTGGFCLQFFNIEKFIGLSGNKNTLRKMAQKTISQ
jgi:hypothetical protein